MLTCSHWKSFIIKVLGLCCLVAISASVHAKTKLHFATLNWEPYYGESLPEQGFYAAISRAAFDRAGYELTIEFVPWTRALAGAKAGVYDGLLGAYYSRDRIAALAYSDAVSHNDENLLQVRGRGIRFNSFFDLQRYRVASLRDSVQSQTLRDFGITVIDTDDTKTAVNLLLNERYDLFTIGKQQFNYLFSVDPDLRAIKHKVELIEPAFRTYKLYNAVSRKRPDADEVVSAFNSALDEMRKDGSYDSILQRFDKLILQLPDIAPAF